MATTRGKRGPYQKSQARKDQIAQAVLNIVDDRGPGAITVAEVAQIAGIPEPSVLYHFPTKDHLLVSALRLADNELSAATGAETLNQPLDLAPMRRQGVYVQWPNPNRLQLEAAVFALATDPAHPAHHYVSERNVRAFVVWRGIVVRSQLEGSADPELNPDLVAWSILAALQGFSTFTFAEPERWAAQDLSLGDLMADTVLRLMGASAQR